MIRRVAGIVTATPSRPRVVGVDAAGAGAVAGATLLSASSASPLVAESRRYFLNKDKNPYYILNIKPGASKAEIKKAYRVMAAKHHPDAPGGSNEKFQEIQAAYEEIKTGVWVPKGGSGDGSGGGSDGVSQTNNKYGGFQWYTDGKRGNKMSYEKMQERMQKGSSDTKGEFDDDEEEEPAAKSKYRNPMGASDQQVQAWFRLITLWAALFVVCRIALFLLFPPKHTHAPKKPLPEKPRKPPPPKPIQHSPMLA